MLIEKVKGYLDGNKVLTYVFYIGTALLGGALIGLLTTMSVARYEDYIKPILSPPAFLFGIVWPILYILMGISAARIDLYRQEGEDVGVALKLYFLQLGVNFLWPILFFTLDVPFLAFLCIVALLILIIILQEMFSAIDEIAGKLLIPYILWVCFAAYLNFGLLVLN